MKITVVGIGYVGLSLACLLAKNNPVTALDVVEDKVNMVNDGCSPLKDNDIEQALEAGLPNLHATLDANEAYDGADLIIVATPTDYDENTNSFDTSSVDSSISVALEHNKDACIVIKSTVPVGYTASVQATYPKAAILFSPEFLREGRALYDNLHPSRIIVGVSHEDPSLQEKARSFIACLTEAVSEEEATRTNPDGSTGVPTLIMEATEAETVKLLSNTYLALRVSFFNELDTFAAMRGLDAARIIEGVGLDPRIGTHYNNPSFGYGGYCLPKDTKQMLANYQDIPQNIMQAIVESNATRKRFVADQIVDLQPQTVGVYRLAMKAGADNFRQSSIIDVMTHLADAGIELIVYEPVLDSAEYQGHEVVNDLGQFKGRSDIIISNRFHPDIEDCAQKVYTRDIWHNDE